MATELAEARAELAALRSEMESRLAEAAQTIFKLNEENELLAEANEQLRVENITLKAQLEELQAASVDTSLSSLSLAENTVPEALLTPGDGVLPVNESVSVDQAHVMNVLSVGGHFFDADIIASGGADKFVKVHNWTTKSVVTSYDAGAPVLAVSFHPKKIYANYLLVSTMDGKHRVLHLDNERLNLVQQFHDHTRQGNIRHAWLTTGFGFATGASDKTAHVYFATNEDGSPVQFAIAKSFYFNGTIEAMTVVPPTGNNAEQLVISIRDDCYMHYVDCSTLEKTRINMNVDGIEHVSYTMMDLQTSPSGEYLLVATDANRHFIIKVRSNVVLRSFYGHKAGPYSQPRVTWHASEKYIISNTEGEGGLVMWCVASEKVIHRIKAHEKLLRDLWYNQLHGIDYLVTGSYDKSLKLWQVSSSSSPS
ncbi:hypothetical protein LEN26_006157 [Aphanomyces euteiches]|nr:hypothetical protein AeMF1_013080 [Aphanomyces euteiches]KAH9136424.1 hypothetical protein LEN26_006157 [Aphanomyces euteiches]KAH9165194.1 hypothetical protein AeNC1_018566 [Aphanomyces euteiches]